MKEKQNPENPCLFNHNPIFYIDSGGVSGGDMKIRSKLHHFAAMANSLGGLELNSGFSVSKSEEGLDEKNNDHAERFYAGECV